MSDIIIPKGYGSVIIPEGKYGKLRFCGDLLDIKATEQDVYSCEEAALMRGYPIEQELKTALLETSSAGLVLVHIPGNKLLNLKEVKYALKEEYGGGKQQACRAGLEAANALYCVYGTLNPFSEFLAQLPQFVSADVLDTEVRGTNAGTLNRFVQFNPALLLKMKDYTKLISGSFSKEKEK